MLRSLLGIPDEVEARDSGLQGRRRREIVDVLMGQFLPPRETGPALVIFEDLQWADRGTLDILRSLVGAIVGLPILLVATTRDDRALAVNAAPNLRRLPLARLDGVTAAALIVETAGERRLATRIVETILERSDGIPLFVEEITKAVVEAASEAEGAVPMTLRDSLVARLDVSPVMKAVAQIAACIGREFEESVLRQSADLSPGMLGEGLERLATAGLIVAETGGRYRFRHALLCDIAYETLLKPRRQSLHERIANALEAMPGDRGSIEPEVLARHWFGAGQHERAESLLVASPAPRCLLARPIRRARGLSGSGCICRRPDWLPGFAQDTPLDKETDPPNGRSPPNSAAHRHGAEVLSWLTFGTEGPSRNLRHVGVWIRLPRLMRSRTRTDE